MNKACLAIILTLILILLCIFGLSPADPELAQPPAIQSAEPTLPPAPEESESPPALTPEADPTGYFDRAVFVGDSLMEGIRQYVAQARQKGDVLGEAQFLTSIAGISLADSSSPAGIQYRYQGEDRSLTELLTQLEPERVFVLLGTNDLATGREISDITQDYAGLIEQIRQVIPGGEVVVLTNPPKVASRWLPDYTANRDFDNDLIDELAEAVEDMCSRLEVPWVDLHTALSGAGGALPDDWCRDGFLHLNGEGAKAAVEAIERFAQKTEEGAV